MQTMRKATYPKIERGDGGALVVRQDGIRLGEIAGSVGRYLIKDRAGRPIGTAPSIPEAVRKLTEQR